MQEKIVYVCQNCRKEFESKSACLEHEDKCMDKIKLYQEQLADIIKKLENDYGTLLEKINYEVINNSFNDEDNHYTSSYATKIYFTLSNGNSGNTYFDLLYYDKNIIYEKTKEEINKYMSTSYEGVIHLSQDDDGWELPMIGNAYCYDIAKVLNGRKVKIEPIE